MDLRWRTNNKTHLQNHLDTITRYNVLIAYLISIVGYIAVVMQRKTTAALAHRPTFESDQLFFNKKKKN